MNIAGMQHPTQGMDTTQTLERQVLQDLQDVFSKTNHIYMQCVDSLRGPITQVSSSPEALEYVENQFYTQRQRLIQQFRDGDLENVIDLPLEAEELLMRGVAIRGEERKLLGVWIMMGIDEVSIPQERFIPSYIRRTSRTKFDDATELLELLTQKYIGEKIRNAQLSDDLGEIEVSGRKTEALLRKNETFTEILKLLESEDDFVQVAERILKSTGEYLKLDCCGILRLSTDDTTVDMISEYSSGDCSLKDKFQHVEKETLPFFTGRPYTISSETLIPDAFMNFFLKYGITAGIFLPIRVGNNSGLYACFVMKDSNRKWSLEEVKFLNDVKRVLQTVLVKRVTKNSLASSYHTLESILENTGCGIAVIDLRTRGLLFTNEYYKEIMRQEADSTNLNTVMLDVPSQEQKHLEYHAVVSDHWYELTFEMIHWVDGRSVRLCTIYDISDIKQYQKRIERQANMDYLTGLYNRKRCETDLALEIRNAIRMGSTGAMFYIDLDDFKNINDGLGHSIGDALLQAVAEELQRITGVGVRAYRAGGDEFIVIIPSVDQQQLEKAAQKIMHAFTTPWHLDGKDYYCTMSMGVVHFPQDGEDVETLMKRADFALRDAKKHGKNHVEYYSEACGAKAVERLDMERALRTAVEQDCQEFSVYYQPIVDATVKEHPCVGAEALVRWKSKDLGFVMPSDFVPLAEYLGLIIPIGRHVLVEACKRCKYWNDFGHPEYKVHVNLSIIQLVRDDIISTVQGALNETGIMPQNLVLEVTEGLAVQDMTSMRRILDDLKEMGVGVALDDFGTGYSSLSYIRDMPLDTIKIDKSFIDHLGQDEFADAFVRTVSSLAESLHVNVVVEGVEEQKQTEALEHMNVDMIQGYFYDKPLPQDQFELKYLA